jgi:exonuclease SbcC
MIPHTLRIRNFLSYGSELQTIDFSPHHLICLSGKNGHGKSALLDAMTWAIWGQARKILSAVKPDEGLMRLGQKQMTVLFDFFCNGNLYRIRRECTYQGPKLQVHLEFGIFDEKSNAFLSLTDKTIRDTQKKIESVLHISYESFLNSAFLRQGGSQEFSKKSPKDRKDIVANILGLTTYETIRRRALETVKQAHIKRQALMPLQEKMAAELAHKDSLQQQYTILQEQRTALQAHITHIMEQKELFMREKTAFVHEEKERDLLQTQYGEYRQQEQTLIQTMRQTSLLWKKTHKARLAHSTTALEHKKQHLTAALAEQQKIYGDYLQLKEQLLMFKEQCAARQQELKQIIDQNNAQENSSRERIQAELAHVQTILAEIAEKYIPTDQARTQHLHKLNDIQLPSLDAYAQERASVLAHLEKYKNAYRHFCTQQQWIARALEDTHHKHELLDGKHDTCCPLCEQSLSADQASSLARQYERTHSRLRHQNSRLERVIKKIQISIDQDQKKEQLLEKNETEARATIQQHQELQTLIQVNTQLLDELTTRKTTYLQRHAALEQEKINLAQKNPASAQEFYRNDVPYMTALHAVEKTEKAVETLGYNQHKAAQITQELAELERAYAQYEQTIKHTEQQQERMNTVQHLCRQTKTIRTAAAVIQTKIGTYASLDHKKQQLLLKEQELIMLYNQARENKEQLLGQQAACQEKLARIALIEQEYATHQATVAALSAVINDYQIIAHATGKDGIQALLIEHAIPEIEHEANILLGKLTNNQAHISIESLKDLKSGGTKETLDINISDSAGIRSYELFSGGEAFRIDFALRIAISKLLAKRAGTALQTLIIDEGFGSQDEEGLSYILDAIHKIYGDFEKIIIVSHLPFMKDQFPVHFFVEKGPSGSMVHVLQQG